MNINDPIAIQNMEEENKKQKQAKGTEVDYERKNLERLQKIQEKKAQELAMMEEERLKAKEQREKLRQIVSFTTFLNIFIFKISLLFLF